MTDRRCSQCGEDRRLCDCDVEVARQLAERDEQTRRRLAAYLNTLDPGSPRD